jgi:hypothetical protein
MRRLPLTLLLLLIASLGLSAAAQASSARPVGLTDLLLPPETRLADDEEEVEVEEVEWEDEEEGEEEDEWEEWEEGEEPPAECLLRTASARAVVPTDENQVRLTIRYTTFETTEGAVDYSLRGSKGALRLPKVRQRLSRHGVLRLTEPLTEGEAERARAASDFTVRLRLPGAPSECKPVLTRHLTIKRAVNDRIVFRQSDSIFGTEA